MKIKLKDVFFCSRRKLLLKIMKAFIFLWCTAIFSFTTTDLLSQNAKISIEADALVSVDMVFDIIMDQTDYKFIYSEGFFDSYPKVALYKGVIKANKLLNRTLENSNVTYEFLPNNTIAIVKKSESKNLFQQQITGKVVDEFGNPLLGMNVYVTTRKYDGSDQGKDFLTRGTSTDFDGNFKIMADAGNFLFVGGIGYERYTTEIIEGRTEYNIVLKEDISELDEVLVVGYGTTTKKDLTGSVGTIKAEEIKQIKSQTVEKALYGKIPGVYVQSAGGRPGAASSVIIRGLSQINGDNQPLYVVDNIPININANSRNSDGLLTNSRFAGSRSNPLLSINPADIESLTVLKDASAAAIYGSRAANGVIIITTKRGKQGEKPRFTFSSNTTIQNPRARQPFLNGKQYREVYGDLAQAFLNSSGTPEADWASRYPNQYAIVNSPETYFGDQNTDWQDEITNKNALWTDYSLGVSGGTEKVNYAMSANVQNQDALFKGGNFKRYTFSSSIDAFITDRIKFGASINLGHTIDKSSGLSNLKSDGSFRSDFPVKDENGNFTSNGLVFGVSPRLNPLGDDARIRNKNVGNTLFGSIYGQVEIVKNLTFKSQLSLNSANDKVNNFQPSFTSGAVLAGLNGNLISFGQPAIGILTTQHNDSYGLSFSNTLNYNTTLAQKHNINALVGLSWDSSRSDAVGTNFAGFPDDHVLVNPASATYTYNGDSDHAQKALNSVFGRVNYNYDDKYLLTLTGRADRSTQFGKDNRTGFFPSAGIAWNVHNEEFLSGIEGISQLKLRASLGRTGNDNLPAFLFKPVFAVEGGFNNATQYNGISGFRLQGVSNSEIRWEQTDQLDIALEVGLFNNRLNAELTWFDKSTSDLILLTPVSAQTGFSNYRFNLADVSNKGWEFQIGGDVIRTNDFNWNSSFNISFIKNNVDNLKGGQSDSFNNFGVIEGYPLGTLVGRDVTGIAQTQAEIDALNAGAPDGQYDTVLLAPGDYIARDVDGDGEITTLDNVPLADGNQADYFGGWNNTLTYKNFDLTFNFQFVQGIDKVRSFDEFIGGIRWDEVPNLLDDVYDTWTPQNTNAKYARAGSRGLNTVNSRFVSDASYVSLRSAGIGYNFSGEWLKKSGINNAKLTFSGNNLFLIHNYDGIDPESAELTVGQLSTLSNGNDRNFAYPQARTFTLGLNVTF